jgi:hypothetical protein
MLPNSIYQKRFFSLILFSINIILIAFSPYLSLGAMFVSLIVAEAYFGKKSYRYFLPFVTLLLAYLASSRGIFETPKDDLADYYKNFITLSNGNFMGLFEFGQGLEIGFPTLSAVISLIAPNAPPRLFLFFHLVFIFSLFFFFLDKLFIAKSSSPAIFICIVCLFLGYTGIANLLRQSYASIFILASFGYVGRKKLTLIVLATLFHFSSPFIYFFIKWFIKPSKVRFIYTLLFSIITYALIWKFILPTLEQYSYLKLGAYLSENNDGLDIVTIVRAYKEIVLFGVFGLVFYFLNYWKSLAAVYFSLTFIMLVILFETVLPGITLRLNHAIISYCIGPLIFYMLTVRKSLSFISIVIIVPFLFVFKTVSFITNPNDMALFNDQTLIYDKPFGYIDFVAEDIPNDKRNWKKLNYQ